VRHADASYVAGSALIASLGGGVGTLYEGAKRR